MAVFHWLYNNVLGNIIASAITASIAYWRLRIVHKRHHKQLQDHIDYQFNKLSETNT